MRDAVAGADGGDGFIIYSFLHISRWNDDGVLQYTNFLMSGMTYGVVVGVCGSLHRRASTLAYLRLLAPVDLSLTSDPDEIDLPNLRMNVCHKY